MSTLDTLALNITFTLTGIAFLVLSVVFAKGKGAFLISGYNTASPSQNQAWALCKIQASAHQKV